MKIMKKQLGEPQKRAWAALLTSHAVLTREIDRDLREAGVSNLEVYDVLLALESAADHRLRLCELADRVVFSPSGLTRLLDRMTAQGWVVREPHPADRRSLYAVLTPAGFTERERTWAVYSDALQRRLGSNVSDREATLLADTLLRLCPPGVLRGRISDCSSSS